MKKQGTAENKTMKVGIDSYCFHRLFGEVYPHQEQHESSMTMEKFIDYAVNMRVGGVSLESCFFSSFDAAYLKDVKASIDDAGLDRVYAWGHPDGLEGGSNELMFREMIEHISHAAAIGADVMRVVGSSLMFRFEPHEPQLKQLAKWFGEAQRIADDHGIKLAVENHIDYNSDEICQLLDGVNNENFGVNFDSGNFVRVLDDPVEAMRKLAPRVWATHIKDLMPVKGVPVTEWYFFSCVPTGKGLVDNAAIAQLLADVHYQGFLAVETDTLHTDYAFEEYKVVSQSIQELKRIAAAVKPAVVGQQEAMSSIA
ncbi:MAG: sugar phosphate isomerase/epimerase [Planctomycetes bacterium]|nr:sugar phosphate isomerase/epimerase [Planctomycetota bacterium]